MSGPGRGDRKGISIFELMRMFPDDQAAEKWFVEQRWPDGINCPECGSLNVFERESRKPQPYRCRERECRKYFSVRTDTLMHGSNLSYQVWAFALYMMTTALKGHSSLKIHRELGVTQRTAWYLAHRIREAFDDGSDGPPLGGGGSTVEVDETLLGGRHRNWDGWSKKTIVVGAKDRVTKRVCATTIERADKRTLQAFVVDNVEPGAVVHTDEAPAYRGIPFEHESVNHGAREYVRGDVHTNGIESFWSMIKRAHKGTYHKMSKKHAHRYVREFVGRQNVRGLDTLQQMEALVRGMEGRRLRYVDVIGKANPG